MTLRGRLLFSFLFIVLLLGGFTIFEGSQLIAKTIFREAQDRTTMDLRAARSQIDNCMKFMQNSIENYARQPFLSSFIKDRSNLIDTRVSLEKGRIQAEMDILSLTDSKGNVILRTRHPYSTGGNRATDPIVDQALAGQASSGILLLYSDELKMEGSDLPRQAFINLVDTPLSKPRPETTESSGMMLWTAAPVRDEGGKVIGVLYGGTLLNRNWSIVDKIADVVFGGAAYEGQKLIGKVTIFLRDVRIATNVKDKSGNRAIGTRVSAEVYDRVYENGQRWHARAFVVNDWYISAYEPIYDPTKKIIGILYTGILEKKYNDLRDMINRSFLLPIIIAVFIAILLSFLLEKMVLTPVQELRLASQEMAKGNLDYRPKPSRSSPELDTLVQSFRQMSEAISLRDEELKAMNLQLTGANERLTQLNFSYMEMLGFISHELKSPLNSMIFGTSSLKDGYLGPINDQQKETLERILKNTEYLETMISHYLNLSRIEKGELEIRKRSANFISEVLNPILIHLENQIKAVKMTLDNKIPKDLSILADPNLIRIVMDNLLSNAAKYGREEGRIELSAIETETETEISVWNEGEGITPDGLKKLFGKFVRLDQPHERKRKGTGLGLFISHEIIQQHHGEIWAESEVGKWTRFTFVLPKI